MVASRVFWRENLFWQVVLFRVPPYTETPFGFEYSPPVSICKSANMRSFFVFRVCEIWTGDTFFFDLCGKYVLNTVKTREMR